MFPAPMPPMPPEIMDAAAADPAGFADALATGMDAFQGRQLLLLYPIC